MNKIGLVGGGAREHIMAETLRKSGLDIVAFAHNLNPGIKKLAIKYNQIDESKVSDIAEEMSREGIDMAVVGPEKPLVLGITDLLEKKGIRVFGPDKKGAMIEGSKYFTRELLNRNHIEGNIKYQFIKDRDNASRVIESWEGDFAIKPVGLTGGKGVKVLGEQLGSRREAVDYAFELLEQYKEGFIIEERVYGEEFTLQAIVSKNNFIPLPLVQDHKKLLDGDNGPNTGGMGSYSMEDGNLPFIPEYDKIKAVKIMKDSIDAMRREGVNYKGILYGGFMETADGPLLLEYNCRFGDPEIINILTSLKTDFYSIVKGTIENNIDTVAFNPVATVCRYVVPRGYGTRPVENAEITVEDSLSSMDNPRIYYASVNMDNGGIYTTSSRSIAVVGYGSSIAVAEEKCGYGVGKIHGNLHSRTDIGKKESLERKIANIAALRKGYTHHTHP
ncbi:MAG: phosphoribosylamine--glycine ligase [Candidatus Thermoplasmatota archaeon]|nr:phosphoribosylamine--glycine ligase [Candidatus Thermoplasmatota archaeon]MCL5963061.1 phosphoribosylamine--glycine ligase [Candidatus Thermoplasmatota archaeon]